MKIFTFLLLPLVILFHVLPNNCGLFKACYEGNLVAFNSLVQDHFVYTSQPDENGVTPLMAAFLGYKVAQKHGIEDARIRGCEKIIRILLEQDYSLFARSSRGTTLFMLAASTGSVELLKIMLRVINGSNEQFLSGRDIEGKTAFYHALENRHITCMQALEKWALVSDAKLIKSGRDELMYAITTNNSDIITAVARLPYTQFSSDHEGNNVFHYLALYGDPSGLIFQKFHVMSPKPQGATGLATADEKLKKAMCSGNKDFLTPMHLAVQKGNQECVEFFFANARDESIRVHDCLGRSPMHYVTSKRTISASDRALIDFFIEYENKNNIAEKESLFNIRDNDGNTPCMQAVSNDSIEIVKHVSGKKVGLIAQNNAGENPLHIAVQNNSASMVLALVEYYNALSSGSLTDSAQGNVLTGLLLQKNKLHMTPLDLAGLASFSDCLSTCQKALSLSFKSV